MSALRRAMPHSAEENAARGRARGAALAVIADGGGGGEAGEPESVEYAYGAYSGRASRPRHPLPAERTPTLRDEVRTATRAVLGGAPAPRTRARGLLRARGSPLTQAAPGGPTPAARCACARRLCAPQAGSERLASGSSAASQSRCRAGATAGRECCMR